MADDATSNKEFKIGTALALAALAFGLFPSVVQMSPLVTASFGVLCVLSLGGSVWIFADVLPWKAQYRKSTRYLTIVGCLVIAYWILFPPPTYVYLIVGRGLGEASVIEPDGKIPRRVFVIKQVGPVVLHNVIVTLHDNQAQPSAQRPRRKI